MDAYHHGCKEQLFFTQHAIDRMSARRISHESVLAAIDFGRVVYAKGAKYFVIGRKEVKQYSNVERCLRRYEGLHVVCVGNQILTVFRNHNLSVLRKYCH